MSCRIPGLAAWKKKLVNTLLNQAFTRNKVLFCLSSFIIQELIEAME